MQCRYCGRRLPVLKRLANEEFCCQAHEQRFREEQNVLALARLEEARRKFVRQGATQHAVSASKSFTPKTKKLEGFAQDLPEMLRNRRVQTSGIGPEASIAQALIPAMEWRAAPRRFPAGAYRAPSLERCRRLMCRALQAVGPLGVASQCVRVPRTNLCPERLPALDSTGTSLAAFVPYPPSAMKSASSTWGGSLVPLRAGMPTGGIAIPKRMLRPIPERPEQVGMAVTWKPHQPAGSGALAHLEPQLPETRLSSHALSCGLLPRRTAAKSLPVSSVAAGPRLAAEMEPAELWGCRMTADDRTAGDVVRNSPHPVGGPHVSAIEEPVAGPDTAMPGVRRLAVWTKDCGLRPAGASAPEPLPLSSAPLLKLQKAAQPALPPGNPAMLHDCELAPTGALALDDAGETVVFARGVMDIERDPSPELNAGLGEAPTFDAAPAIRNCRLRQVAAPRMGSMPALELQPGARFIPEPEIQAPALCLPRARCLPSEAGLEHPSAGWLDADSSSWTPRSNRGLLIPPMRNSVRIRVRKVTSGLRVAGGEPPACRSALLDTAPAFPPSAHKPFMKGQLWRPISTFPQPVPPRSRLAATPGDSSGRGLLPLFSFAPLRSPCKAAAGMAGERTSGQLQEILFPRLRLEPDSFANAHSRRPVGLFSGGKFGLRLAEPVLEFWRVAPADLKWITLALPVVLLLSLLPTLTRSLHTPLQSARSAAAAPPAASAQTAHAPADGFVGRFLATHFSSLHQAITQRAAIHWQDDFRSGLSAWEGEQDWASTWSYDEAGFVHPGNLALARPTRLMRDYTFEFFGQIESKALSWAIRAADHKNYYAMKIAITRPGPLPEVSLIRQTVLGGKRSKAQRLPLPVVGLRSDTLYRVRVEVAGNSFSTYVQGQLVDTFTSDELKSGGIGFFSDAGERARLRWAGVSYQYDFLGRLCALLAPYNLERNARSWR